MKKYTAPSITEAMKLVREDLGEDAVIINSKVVETKKFFGLVKNKRFEVLAGVDRDMPIAPVKEGNDFFAKDKGKLPTPTFPEVHKENHNDELKAEIADLKSMILSMKQESMASALPENIQAFLGLLKQKELGEQLITAIRDELFHYSKQDVTEAEMVQIAKEVLKKELAPLTVGGMNSNKKYIHVLGPTGVGKTTTIAKMAARSVLEKKKKIGFITTDTYRIAAIEQLKTYANLLQAPVEVVYNEADYKKAIDKYDHLDFVFIDTAGRNYKEEKYVRDLKKLIPIHEEMQSYLVLSMTSKQQDMEAIIEQFEEFPIDQLIFTKLDETNTIGSMFNLMVKYNKGLAYYTNGQEVPEDIEEANLDQLLELFFRGEFQ
jgi:flagellar biosynthesis protein FlhF